MNSKIFTTFLLLLVCSRLNAQYWQLVSPSPNPPALIVSIPDSIHLKGYNDHIFLRSDDGGSTWTGTKLNSVIAGIFFLDSLRGWLACDSLRILNTSDGGLTWSQQLLPYTSSLNPYITNLQFVTADTGFCLTDNQLYSTTDGGNVWSHNAVNIHTFCNVSMKFTDPRNGWAECCSDTVIFKTNDGGLTWSSYFLSYLTHITNNRNGLSFIDSLQGWVALHADSILKTTDGGISWQIIPVGIKDGNVFFHDALHGFFWKDETVNYSSDGGSSWSICFQYNGLNFGINLNILESSSEYFISYFGNLYKSSDAFNWKRLETYNFPSITSNLTFPFIKFRSMKTGVAVSGMVYNSNHDVYYNFVYLTTDSCQSWRQVMNGNPPCSDIELVSDQTFYYTLFEAATNQWSINKTNDSFLTHVNIGTSSSPAICFTDSIHGVSYGQYTTDGGMTWNASAVNGGNGGFKDIFFHNQNEGWAIDSADVFHTTDGGINWTNIFNSGSSTEFSKIEFTDSLNGTLADHFNGILLKTVDGGLTWNSLNIPFPCSDFYFHDALRGWVTSQLTSQSQKGIYYTSDGGITLTRQDSLDVNYLSFVDSSFGFAAGSQLLLKSDQSNILSSIKEALPPIDLDIYPNPSSDKIFIHSNDIINSVKLFDQQGKLVKEKNINDESYTLNTQALAEGSYVVKVYFKNRSVAQKMIHLH